MGSNRTTNVTRSRLRLFAIFGLLLAISIVTIAVLETFVPHPCGIDNCDPDNRLVPWLNYGTALSFQVNPLREVERSVAANARNTHSEKLLSDAADAVIMQRYTALLTDITLPSERLIGWTSGRLYLDNYLCYASISLDSSYRCMRFKRFSRPGETRDRPFGAQTLLIVGAWGR